MWNLITTGWGDRCWNREHTNAGWADRINWQNCDRNNHAELWAFIPVRDTPSFIHNNGQPYYPYPPFQNNNNPNPKIRGSYTIRPYTDLNLCLGVPNHSDNNDEQIKLSPCDHSYKDHKQQIYIEWVDHSSG